jgi:hypothetical protein
MISVVGAFNTCSRRAACVDAGNLSCQPTDLIGASSQFFFELIGKIECWAAAS